MFSRNEQRKSLGGGAPPSGRRKKDDPKSFDSPLDELRHCMDGIEEFVEKIRTDNDEQTIQAQSEDTKKDKQKRLPAWRRGSGSNDTIEDSSNNTNKPVTKTGNAFFSKEREAKFLSIPTSEESEVIELLRRTAELVIIGERGAAKALRKQEKMQQLIAEGKEVDIEEDDTDFETHMAIFEQFFERNILSLIVNIVTGVAFRKEEVTQGNGQESQTDNVGTTDEEPRTMLPPLPIATQAVQSVSILIQNVSHATSLYFLLSNNHINELIDFPLELYTIAESNKRGDNSNGYSTKKYSSPEIAELTTHFVSFLKSLAMRMNTETLQFYLTYPTESAGDDCSGETFSAAHFSDDTGPDTRIDNDDDEDRPLDEIGNNVTPIKRKESMPVSVKKVEVQFPLYARALEFCSPHQDSFVRVTAMNVCLNTLRLCTIGPRLGLDPDNVEDPEETDVLGGLSMSSPDGVLHNAEPLPLRERLAIAQHVCAPSRVEGLISPIFTKLAQLWGIIEEALREMDSTGSGMRARGSSTNGEDDFRSASSKAGKAKKEVRKRRLTASLNDAVANLQDELLLLEDVFKVGLTSLNEQIIEMMLATFIYPLLLQPLLLFMQRFPSMSGSGRDLNSPLYDPLIGDEQHSDFLTEGELERTEHHDTAPAKTAFLTLASVFHLITNRPLLRLLLTALFHPMAPEASGETMIRAKPDVACSGPDGELYVRLDEPTVSNSTSLNDNKSMYLFGKVTGQRGAGASPSAGDQCVFVLSPVLADVLENQASGSASFIARTRPNPYRRSILACLAEAGDIAGLRNLSVLAMDAALSRFDGKFVCDMLFGTGMKSFSNDIPMDERRLDTKRVHKMHDRGMGGRASVQSRRSLQPASPGGVQNFVAEVVASLCVGVVNATSQWKGVRVLEYDKIAAHALLCAIRDNPRALQMTAKFIERRRSQTASFMSQLPSLIDKTPVTRLSGEFRGGPSAPKSIPEDDEQRLGLLMNRIFYERHGKDNASVIEGLVRTRTGPDMDNRLIAISQESSFDDISPRICNSEMKLDPDVSDELTSLEIAKTCAASHLHLDALCNLIQDLAATNGNALKNRKLTEYAFTNSGQVINFAGSYEKELRRSLYASISQSIVTTIVEEQEVDSSHHRDKGLPEAGSVVGLVGRTAFPCVCEVPAANAKLFTDDAACVVAEGVKWQSLYLVFLGRYMVLAEPEKGGSGGNGRIITACSLSKLNVEKDVQNEDSGSPARRLLLSHDWYEKMPPSLFLLEEKPCDKILGPFACVQSYRSCMDLWFEDENAADRAYKIIDTKLTKSRSRRGNRIREKLSDDDIYSGLVPNKNAY